MCSVYGHPCYTALEPARPEGGVLQRHAYQAKLRAPRVWSLELRRDANVQCVSQNLLLQRATPEAGLEEAQA